MAQLSEDIQSLLNRESSMGFVEADSQFVALLESEFENPEAFYSKAHKAITQLYLAGLNLEHVELKYSSEKDDFEGIPQEKLREMNKSLISNLGKDSYYWEVFDPTYTEDDGKPGEGWQITDREASQGWLVDDFADMYAEMKTELNKILTIRTDKAVEDAFWQMKFSFNHHWGNHCINAMRALHYLWYPGKVAM